MNQLEVDERQASTEPSFNLLNKNLGQAVGAAFVMIAFNETRRR
jgi:hypothetical protein